MKSFLDQLSYYCFGFGVFGLIPVSASNTLVMPLWASLSMIGASVAYSVLFLARRNRLQ